MSEDIREQSLINCNKLIILMEQSFDLYGVYDNKGNELIPLDIVIKNIKYMFNRHI